MTTIDHDDELTWAPAWRLRELMIAKELSPVELTRHFLARIERLDPTLRAFITVCADEALEQAREAEAAISSGAELGPLHGIPLAIKDQFWTRGVRTTGGSLLYRDFVPTEDSVHAERVRRAGAVILGKTNLSEFAMLGRTVNRLMEETRNPWDPTRISGGSSGGSASAVGAGMVPIAVASDGGGSTRLPAAYCGVVGMRPGAGRVPNHGGFGGGLLTSAVGPIARNTRDAAMLLQVLSGPDERDATCMPTAAPDFSEHLGAGVRGMRIAWAPDFGFPDFPAGDPGLLDTVRTAALRFEELGAEVEEISLGLDDTDIAWQLLGGADRYAVLGERVLGDPVSRAQLTPYVEAMFVASRAVTGADYSRAMRVRYEAIARLRRLFERYDLIVTPTTLLPPRTASPHASALREAQPRDYTVYTRPFNLTGFAATSVPCGFVDDLPVGMQVIGLPEDDATVLRACQAFEEAVSVGDRRPALA